MTGFQQEEQGLVAGRSTVRTAALDAELDAAALSISQIRENLNVIQRDDTHLRDAVVELHTLASDVLSLIASGAFNVRGDWVTATAYALGDIVQQGGFGYLCSTAHTSGVFATDLATPVWIPLTVGSASLVYFSPSGIISSTNVQAAIEEVAVDLAAGSFLYLHQNFGGI